MADWSIWINLGVPMVILAAAGAAVWKSSVYVGHKLFDEKGIIPDWVNGEKQWRGKLVERLENQQVLCGAHAGELKALTAILEEQKVVSLAAQKGVAQSNEHLSQLVAIHTDAHVKGSTAEAIQNISQLKQVAATACEGCREAIGGKPENVREVVLRHCEAIERILKLTS
jgi:hypothetical protein